jgi:ubiquinone/menaquinone biosynthesis C-methylase UbiE
MNEHNTQPWTGLKARLYAAFHRNPAANRAVVQWANLQPDMHILDLGCGTGAAVIAAAAHVPDGTAVGIDPSPTIVQIAKRRTRHHTNVVFDVAATEQLPFESNRFDIAWSVHSTHHWPDLDAGISEVRRVLRPNSRFLIVERHDPAKPWGISIDAASAVAETMTGTGFLNVTVDHRRVGRNKEFLITGTTPPGDN